LTLCSDRILHEPNFNFFLLASLVMKNLQNYTDLAIIQPGVAVLALLTTRVRIRTSSIRIKDEDGFASKIGPI
jgi:hypothetical protein